MLAERKREVVVQRKRFPGPRNCSSFVFKLQQECFVINTIPAGASEEFNVLKLLTAIAAFQLPEEGAQEGREGTEIATVVSIRGGPWPVEAH